MATLTERDLEDVVGLLSRASTILNRSDEEYDHLCARLIDAICERYERRLVPMSHLPHWTDPT